MKLKRKRRIEAKLRRELNLAKRLEEARLRTGISTLNIRSGEMLMDFEINE